MAPPEAFGQAQVFTYLVDEEGYITEVREESGWKYICRIWRRELATLDILLLFLQLSFRDGPYWGREKAPLYGILQLERERFLLPQGPEGEKVPSAKSRSGPFKWGMCGKGNFFSSFEAWSLQFTCWIAQTPGIVIYARP